MKIKGLLILILLIAVSAVFVEGEFNLTYSFSGDMTMSVEVDGIEREYFVHIPEGYNSEELFPVVFVLHGGGGNAEKLGRYTGFTKLADQEKFIVVYPQGYDKHWNDGRKNIKSKAHEEDINDIKFFNEMIKALNLLFKIDESRIYAVGISNGAMMSFRIACELSDKFAAIAAIAGSCPEVLSECTPENPISILIINGTDDPLVPFHGGNVKVFKKTRGKILSTMETIKKFVLYNECGIKPVNFYDIDTVKDDDMIVHVQEYKNEKTGVEVVLYKIEGGGHTWPGKKQYAPKFMIGKTNKDIDATEVIWNFFKNKKLQTTEND